MNINWRPRDEDLSKFIGEFVDSFASWDLILYLHFNPEASETSDGFASKLGRSVDDVYAALSRFCELGCVSKSGQAANTKYSPSLSPEMKKAFAKFAHAQEDRELRLTLIRSILARSRE